MKKVSVKRLSVLGIVLMAASAVTAAVLPSRSSDMKFDGSEDNATLISNSGDGGGGGALSCVTDITNNWSCHLSANATVTTGAVQSDFGANRTVDNTSNSIPNNSVDTTSAAS